MTLDTSRVLAGGHRWARCDTCGRPAVVTTEGGRCRQRAAIGKRRKLDDGTEAVRWSCGGTMAFADAIAKGDDERCSRAGCRNVAALTTAIGERVCCRCLGALAAAIGP